MKKYNPILSLLVLLLLTACGGVNTTSDENEIDNNSNTLKVSASLPSKSGNISQKVTKTSQDVASILLVVLNETAKNKPATEIKELLGKSLFKLNSKILLN